MKRRFGTVIAMVLCFILTVVSVYADELLYLLYVFPYGSLTYAFTA